MLTLRGLLLVLAVGGIIGLVDTREFIGIFPFNVQIILDVVAVSIFLFLVWKAPVLLPDRKNQITGLISFVWLYTIVGNVGNLWIFISALGLSDAIEYLGTTLVSFIAIQVTTLLLIPTLIFALLLWCIHSIAITRN
jgi:hypothetical protein